MFLSTNSALSSVRELHDSSVTAARPELAHLPQRLLCVRPEEPWGHRSVDRATRNELRLSQEKAATLVRLHWTDLRHVERGYRNLTWRNILKIAHGLDVDAASGRRPC
jgi:DNA-binding XRE family transcriptional regulator